MSHGLQNESDFLEFLNEYFPNQAPAADLGRGDDAAVLNWPHKLVISTDLFVEDIHFRRRYFRAREIGYKSLAVNISDICAMGCTCLGFSLGLQIPADNSSLADKTFWTDFFAGMSSLANEHNLFLTGGDLCRGPCLGISITIFGTPLPHGRILKRNQSRPDDTIIMFVTPGLARAGLHALEQSGREAMVAFPAACRAHLRPEIMADTAKKLACMPDVTSCMDVSDGLACDLPRLTGPTTGTELTIKAPDLHPEVIKFCRQKNLDPVLFALKGGEEYQLLATVSNRNCNKILTLENSLIIGKVSSKPGLRLNGKPIHEKGFDHFSPV